MQFSDFAYNNPWDASNCTVCPRECHADRRTGRGACGCGDEMTVAKIMLHRYEEPPISGTHGSGAIFFTGCNLRCGYCQNAKISHGTTTGTVFSPEALAERALQLQRQGAHNINLVTAAHFLPRIATFLRLVKPHLNIPVVYNSSGYEKTDSIRTLNGLIDIYLPDYKYIDSAAAQRYSGAADYPAVAEAAIAEMVRQTGPYCEQNGIAVRGTIIRHLVLPGLSRDGEKIMHRIAARFPQARVSIMAQYTPSFNQTADPSLHRRITKMEYHRVLDAAAACGLEGFRQFRAAATDRYTPKW